MKKVKAFILTLMAAAQIGTVAANAEYSDVGGHWAENIINQMTSNGIVQGDKNNFRPDSRVNVDEFLKMVLMAMGEETEPASGAGWSTPYINKALEKKLVYADEFDSYNRPVTRGEIAKICTRAINADYVQGSEREQLINKISDFYDIYNSDKEYVLAAYSHRLIYGYEDNTFSPNRNTTRAEACVIVSRMMSAGDFTRPDDGNTPTDVGSSYYVASNGKDTNSGTKDAPFKTVEKARDKIREINAAGAYPKDGITVYLRGGEYYMDKPIVFEAGDSGTEEHPVTYMSYPGETARLTGGVDIKYSDFKAISSDAAAKIIDKTAAKNVLELDLNKLGITDLGQLSRRGFLITANVIPQPELYIDGSRQQLSRWPNTDWVGTTEIVRSGARSQKGVLEGAVYKIDYDRPTKWKTNINEIYTSGVLGPNYFYGYFPIEKIEPGQITLKEGSVTSYYSKHFIRYENIFEEIDAPGEYYIDRTTGMLYLYPPQGMNKDTDIKLSMISENMFSGTNVNNITFKNLKMDSSRAGVIRITGDNINVENCEVSGTGTNGIYLNGFKCSVKNSIIHDIGSTGISMNGGDYDNEISSENVVYNNHVYKAAQIERSYQSGILLGHKSVGITASHNEVHDMPHAAMIVYGPNHTIEYNNIYDAVKEFHDMDAIYMNVYQFPWERNVVFRRNYIHDLGQQTFTERQMNVAGIRTDNNGNGINVIENVFYNIGYQNANGIRGVCAQGIENVIEGNIFVDTSGTYEGAHTYNPDAKWDLEGTNVKPAYEQWKIYAPKYSEKNPEILHFFDHHFAAYAKNNKFKNNVIVNIKFPLGTANITPSGQGFMASEQLVDAENNIVTKQDPGFVNYAAQDFTLKDSSEVYTKIKGFSKIDFKNIGTLSDDKPGVKN